MWKHNVGNLATEKKYLVICAIEGVARKFQE
jgi:hypothetical protein